MEKDLLFHKCEKGGRIMKESIYETVNTNIIFCEEYDKQTNSYTKIFDNIKIDKTNLTQFEMVIIVNRIWNIDYDMAVCIAKMNDKYETEHTVLWSGFNVPENNDGITKRFVNDIFIKTVDLNLIKEKGTYLAIIFAKYKTGEIQEGFPDIDEYAILSMNRLEVV